MNCHLMHYGENGNTQILQMVPFFDAIDSENYQVFYLDDGKTKPCLVDNVKMPQIRLLCRHGNHKDHWRLIRTLSSADRIVMHGFCIDFETVLLILLLRPSVFRKMTWVGLGEDLYHWEKKCSANLYGRIKKRILRQARNRIPKFVGIFKPDVDYYLDQYGAKHSAVFANYSGLGYSKTIFDTKVEYRTIAEKKQSGKPVLIQIGHQGNPVLNHLQILDDLEPYMTDRVNILLPLSYGDKQYCDKVEKYAKEKYPGRIIVLRDFMERSEYYKVLADVDIAVFYTDRQIGLGNLYPLMLFGKKIYMKKGSVMYDFFSSQGCPMQDYDKIKENDAEVFFADVDTTAQVEFTFEQLDEESRIGQWTRVLKNDF